MLGQLNILLSLWLQKSSSTKFDDVGTTKRWQFCEIETKIKRFASTNAILANFNFRYYLYFYVLPNAFWNVPGVCLKTIYRHLSPLKENFEALNLCAKRKKCESRFSELLKKKGLFPMNAKFLSAQSGFIKISIYSTTL